MKWVKHVKPPADVCPQRFCFFWDWNENTCRASSPQSIMKTCKRSDKDADHDWYEPHEPQLEAHDLPWFYFIPHKDKLVAELKDAYEKESKELWG